MKTFVGECVAVTAKAGEGAGHRLPQASGAVAPIGVGRSGTQT